MISNAVFAALFAYLALVTVPRLYAAIRHQAVPIRQNVYRRLEQPAKYWANAVILALVAPFSVFAAVALGHAALVEFAL